MKLRLPILLLACCALSACASGHHRRIPENERPKEWHPSRDLLTKYDANHDGTLTKAELEAGLKAEFNAADVDHNGCLKPDEAAAINEKRIEEQGSTSTPLIDWNQDGCIDFNEFAGTARSLFTQMDRNEDGKLEPKELNPRAAAQGKKGGDRERGGRHHRHGSEGGDGPEGGGVPGPDGSPNTDPDGG
jgi:Ca2+-binding EF-hand superfamily protein